MIDGDGSGGGGGKGGGGGEGGGGGGGGGDEDDEEEEEYILSLSCSAEVERGEKGRCSATVTKDGTILDASQLNFVWSSDVGARKSGTGLSAWIGEASEDATVTVEVSGSGFKGSASRKVKVIPRKWSFPPLNAKVVATDIVRDGSAELDLEPDPHRLGHYRVVELVNQRPKPIEGKGPWKGRWMSGGLPKLEGTIYVSEDYTESGRKYPGANSLDECPEAGLPMPDSVSYYGLNSTCNTKAGWDKMGEIIVEHEKQHQRGFNACLRSDATKAFINSVEKIVGTTPSVVRGNVGRKLKEHITDVLGESGDQVPEYLASPPFWYYPKAWVFGTYSVAGHYGNFAC